MWPEYIIIINLKQLIAFDADAFHEGMDNPSGSFLYAPKTTPRATPETQKQAMDFVSLSPLGKAALGSDAMWNRIKKNHSFRGS